jgi:hypothetical protein
MSRLPISFELLHTMKIHVYGFIGHRGERCISNGEVRSVGAGIFYLTLSSATGFSGSAVVFDSVGDAVGYISGIDDYSKDKTSQHLSIAYSFGAVAYATGRSEAPPRSPDHRKMGTIQNRRRKGISSLK